MKTIDYRCRCGCTEGFRLNFYVEEANPFVIISTTTTGFYAKQYKPMRVIWERIKAAWFMLRGKEYRLHEIVLHEEQWKEFVEDINKANKEMFDDED